MTAGRTGQGGGNRHAAVALRDACLIDARRASFGRRQQATKSAGSSAAETRGWERAPDGAAREHCFTPDVIRIGGLDLRFLQTKDSTAGSLDMFEMTVQPKGRVPVAHHHESWDETVYGLSGCITFRVDGEDVAVRPGSVVFIRRGIVHGFRNDTDEPATCLCTLTPGVLGRGYFEEMAALIDRGAPPADLKATMLRHGLIPAPQA